MNKKSNVIKTCHDLKIYTQSYALAMEIFDLSSAFPNEEKFSLTSQIIRSSRSVPANIREGYAKRKYEQIFIKHLVDALGSSEETRTWLEFARDYQYITQEFFAKLDKKYNNIGAMIFNLMNNWRKIEKEVDIDKDNKSETE